MDRWSLQNVPGPAGWWTFVKFRQSRGGFTDQWFIIQSVKTVRKPIYMGKWAYNEISSFAKDNSAGQTVATTRLPFSLSLIWLSSIEIFQIRRVIRLSAHLSDLCRARGDFTRGNDSLWRETLHSLHRGQASVVLYTRHNPSDYQAIMTPRQAPLYTAIQLMSYWQVVWRRFDPLKANNKASWIGSLQNKPSKTIAY